MMESIGPPATSVLKLDIPNNGPPTTSVKGFGSNVDNDYEVNEKSDEDANSYVSLIDEFGEIDDNGHDHCDPYDLRSTILTDPNLAVKSLKKQLLEKFDVTCDNLTIYRAKKIVLSNLKTYHIASHVQMKKYGNIIIAMNPAIALDGDIGIFPIAFYVCESKTLERWTLFLKFLQECLGWDDRKAICFMRDRQKDELSALDNEWPYVGKDTVLGKCWQTSSQHLRTI
ncbi:hypothetical protein Dsin_030083 [Dipteronia sinensis]|uniref:MULE transposase domain-containing protein n=1 Tax=Dipteronia sinensis TaxID=43782 RepID=A0AAD9ZIS0_9ROSI|nr:hypothetical protein Dsin_030083 [Dipteronia sinensis]